MAAKILSRVSRNWGFGVSEGITRVRVFSTGKAQDSIFKRISPLGDPGTSVVPLLEEWVREGRKVHKSDLQSLVKEMRRYRRYKHALEISQWMGDLWNLSASDNAIRLELICKVHGLEYAEDYFESIPQYLKTFQVYGALLNCFVDKRLVEKAETLVKEMNKFGLVDSSLTYNALMNLYTHTGQSEKLDLLLEDMRAKRIRPNLFTYCLRLNACVLVLDIEGMERILKRMEKEPHIVVNWVSYASVANGYIKAGFVDKAGAMLKKAEATLANGVVARGRRNAYNYLLTLYASIGLKTEVYRIWELVRSLSGKLQNSSYICMISSLVKIGDIEGAEKVLGEWDSSCVNYDFRVPMPLLSFYCKNGLVGKAEEFVNSALERQRVPSPNVWHILAGGYLENSHILMAVEAMKKALKAHQPGWLPDWCTVTAILEYFEGHGDLERIEEFIGLLRPVASLTREVYHTLFRMYIASGKPVLSLIEMMKEDNVDPSEETRAIVDGKTLRVL
ncbi:hypothetical protein AMTRI_Chr07g81920 [Amborella trichopoda]